MSNNEGIEIKNHKWSYEDICKHTFFMIPACDYYVENANGLFINISEDKDKFDELLKNSVQLNVAGVARLNENANYSSFSGSIGYTKALTDYLIDYANKSPVVKAQESSPDVNVVNGMSFAPKDDNATLRLLRVQFRQ